MVNNSNSDYFSISDIFLHLTEIKKFDKILTYLKRNIYIIFTMLQEGEY